METTIPHNPQRIGQISYREHFAQLLHGDLDFHGKNSTYSSHAIHAFPAKFPPQLPRLFIENLTEPGDIILDPMMGSGTTLLEAALLGRRTVGVDIDPLALRIGYSKLNPNSVRKIEEAGLQVIANSEASLHYQEARLDYRLQERFSPENREFINYWFNHRTQIELLALLEEIETIKDDAVRSFLLLNFSSIIITKSGGVSQALDLAHTRPHRVMTKKINSAIGEFRKRLKKNLQGIGISNPDSVRFMTAEGNVEKLPLAKNSVDLIVTSPPYASNAIDYMRAHKFSLVWLGFDISRLGKMRQNYIGGDATRGIEYLSLPPFAQGIVHSLAKIDGKKAQVLHRYFSEMTKALGEMQRVLRPGKAAIIVVGNSVIRGVSTETDRCLGEIGKNHGLDLVHTGVRTLDRDKRMLPVRRNGNGSSSQIEARMHEEYVIGFIKSGG